ncbi:hypothetical protein ACX1GI_17030, partial [Yersinia pseudotuberculosis]
TAARRVEKGCFIEPNLQIMDKKIQDLGFSAKRGPLGTPRFRTIACPLRGVPRFIISLTDRADSLPAQAALARHPCLASYLHSSLGCSNVLLTSTAHSKSKSY